MFAAELLQNVPHSPGVYQMLDKQSRVLYVGKAKDLKKRLTSYVRFTGSEHNKTTVLLSKVTKVDTLLTNTEKEALILEASLIKKHKPRYNIVLRDDKNYPYIKVTVQEDWPRVLMTRRKKKDGARYFGPYSSSSSMWTTLRLLGDMFTLRKCKGATLKKRKRPCLNHQMNKCPAPCINKADPKTYRDQVNKVLMVLEGRNRTLLGDLKQEMSRASDELLFEKAAEIRDQIKSLSRTLEKQIIASSHLGDLDVFGYCRQGGSVGIAILFVRDGLISGNRSFFLSEPMEKDKTVLSQSLNQFYSPSLLPAKEVILPFDIEDRALLEDRFSELTGSKTSLIIPQRGDRYQLRQMADTNASHIFDEKQKQEQAWLSLSKSMQKHLHLNRSPKRVECLDISNTSGKQAVGSLVAFRKGAPAPEQYRHYRIKTVPGPDDYAMMEEVLYRRFVKGIEESNLPDLFMVDGGRGQLGVAARVAGELGILQDIELLGIAKERKEEGEKLYRVGRKNPIILKSHHPVLLYLMQIRDESHRFGVTFHRKLRNKKTMRSALDRIPGVGPERKKNLLKTMGSLKRVKTATQEELCQVKGINKELANTVYRYFHEQEQ